MKILATLPDNMLNLSVHEMMEATRDFGLSKHEGTFKLDINLNDFWEIDNLDYDIIHIHWPEALVDWKIPTENDIKKLNNRLKQLKTQEKKIIITRHNAIPHTKTKLDAALYKTAFSFADAIFHMEKFSYNEYKEFYGEFNWYTKQKHFFAPIIMYSKLPNTISKIEARAALNINPNKFMYLVIGSIRNKKEKILIQNIAALLEDKNDLLFVAQWPFYGNRIILKQIRQLLTKIKFPKHTFKFLPAIPDNKIQLYLNACDVLISPRMDSINSGLISLGFSFSRTVIGPSAGNMGDILKETGNPMYNPSNLNNLKERLNKGKSLAISGHGNKNLEYAKNNWSWEKVGKLHYEAYVDILK